MTFETRIKGVEPIYHEVMGLEPLNNDKINFVHIPGFVGYLSAGFNLITIFFIFTLFILIIKSVEVFVSKISYGDRMCGAIIAYFLVYRMTHSGIYVLDNYKLLLGICIILISYISINSILKFKHKYNILWYIRTNKLIIWIIKFLLRAKIGYLVDAFKLEIYLK